MKCDYANIYRESGNIKLELSWIGCKEVNKCGKRV